MSFNKPVGCDYILNFIQLTEKFARKWARKSMISHTTVNLNEGQAHPKWHQNVESSGPYDHIKFKRNWPVHVQIQANIKGLGFFYKIIKVRFSPLNSEKIR